MDRAKVFPDTYLDSVLLLAATRAMGATEGVMWATSVMATPANLEDLSAQGVTADALDHAGANDLVLAVIAETGEALEGALAAGQEALFATRPARGERTREPAHSLDEACDRLPGANVAIISVPGPFAALEAHKALGAGLHVLLFSDNVDLEEEVELKDRAISLGRLLMGPGAGTAVLGGCGLGFANVVSRGRVGVVAAAGTGAQEVMALLDQWGAGLSQVIGVGGRDLSEAVAGRMAGAAVAALDADRGTDVILLVSKPPTPAVARAVIARSKTTPVIAALIGLDGLDDLPPGAVVTSTLEGGAAETMRTLGLTAPDDHVVLRRDVTEAMSRLRDEQTLVHGLFSGGTLCYESLGLLGKVLGPVYSNIPLDKRHGLPAPDGAHVCLDLGEEEYTKGRPHPMIDPEARRGFLRESGEPARRGGHPPRRRARLWRPSRSRRHPGGHLPGDFGAGRAGRGGLCPRHRRRPSGPRSPAGPPASSWMCRRPDRGPSRPGRGGPGPTPARAGREAALTDRLQVADPSLMRERPSEQAAQHPARAPQPSVRPEQSRPLRCPSVALVTYSVKPRGGVVHTLAVAEALGALASPGRSDRAGRSRPGLLPGREGPVADHSRAPAGPHPRRAGLQLRGCAGQRPPGDAGVAPGDRPHAGLHLGSGRLPGPRPWFAHHRGAHRPPRRRLLYRRPRRLSAPGDPRA